MKIFVSLLFSIAFLSCNLFSDSQKVYDIASKNVVKITSFDEVKNEIRNGYGVSIGKSKCTDTETRDSLLINGFDNSNKGGTDILTTFQTISFASTIFIENKNGEKTEAAVVYIDSQKNIAVIRTKNNLLDTSVNISNKLSVGKKLFFYSFDNISNEQLNDSFVTEIKYDFKIKSFFNDYYTNRIVFVSDTHLKLKNSASVFDENGFLVGFYQSANASNNAEKYFIAMDDDKIEMIKKSKSFNIIHPGEIDTSNWSLGKFYYEKYEGDLAKALIWKESDARWVQWRNIDDALIVIDRARFDRRFNKIKGNSTKSFPADFLEDTKTFLSRQRLAEFQYSVDDELIVNYYSSENNRSIKNIEMIMNKYGRTLYLSRIYFDILYKTTEKSNVSAFKDKVLEYLNKCPRKSESIPYDTRRKIIDFKEEISSLPSYDFDESESTKTNIGQIKLYFEKLGWNN